MLSDFWNSPVLWVSFDFVWVILAVLMYHLPTAKERACNVISQK